MAGYMPQESGAGDYARGKISRNRQNESSGRSVAGMRRSPAPSPHIVSQIFMPLAYKYVIQFIMIYFRLVSTSVAARRHTRVSARPN
jgi:hypothetical protein